MVKEFDLKLALARTVRQYTESPLNHGEKDQCFESQSDPKSPSSKAVAISCPIGRDTNSIFFLKIADQCMDQTRPIRLNQRSAMEEKAFCT